MKAFQCVLMRAVGACTVDVIRPGRKRPKEKQAERG